MHMRALRGVQHAQPWWSRFFRLCGRQSWSLARTSFHVLYPIAPLVIRCQARPAKRFICGRPDSSEQLDHYYCCYWSHHLKSDSSSCIRFVVAGPVCHRINMYSMYSAIRLWGWVGGWVMSKKKTFCSEKNVGNYRWPLGGTIKSNLSIVIWSGEYILSNLITANSHFKWPLN